MLLFGTIREIKPNKALYLTTIPLALYSGR